MNIETEIKYLINHLPNNLPIPNYIEQRYFKMDGKEEVLKQIFNLKTLDNIKTSRVRLIKNQDIKYVLTLKTSGLYSREEYEQIISFELYQDLINQPLKSCIIKNRYIINYANFKFEFDEYLNLKNPLYTVEVETNDLTNQEQIEEILSNVFKLKFKDVTLDPRYKNSNLTKYF